MGAQAEPGSSARRGGRWTVTQRDNSMERCAACEFDDLLRGSRGILEAQRQGAVAPWVLKHMAAVGAVGHVHAKLSGGFGEGARLVSGLGGQQKQAFAAVFHGFRLA